MALHTRISAIGLDAAVQRLQKRLYSDLDARWNGTLDGYGRAYRNIKKDDTFIFEWWNSTKKDYEDVYYNDSSANAVFFFVNNGTSTTDDRMAYVQPMKLIVMCNLKSIIDSDERMDQQAHRDVVEFLRSNSVVVVDELDDNMETIFNNVSTDNIKLLDIQPNHCFSVNISVTYYLTDKCN